MAIQAPLLRVLALQGVVGATFDIASESGSVIGMWFKLLKGIRSSALERRSHNDLANRFIRCVHLQHVMTLVLLRQSSHSSGVALSFCYFSNMSKGAGSIQHNAAKDDDDCASDDVADTPL